MEEPLPCPLCGNYDVRVNVDLSKKDVVYYCRCSGCKVTTREDKTTLEAIRLWNYSVRLLR